MSEHRSERDWPSEPQLTVFDETDDTDHTDDADDADGPDGPDDPTDAAPEAPAEDEPAGNGLPLRWCALLAVLSLVLAVAGGSLLNSRRDRTVATTVVSYEHPDGSDLTGCPRDDVCQPLPVPDAPLFARLPPELAHATVLQSSLLLDSTTSQTVRTTQLLVAGGLTMTVIGQCVLGGEPVPARNAVTELPTGGGPTVVAFVRPGKVAGCSAALTVRVPAGRPVPLQYLRQLAEELPQGLVN